MFCWNSIHSREPLHLRPDYVDCSFQALNNCLWHWKESYSVGVTFEKEILDRGLYRIKSTGSESFAASQLKNILDYIFSSTLSSCLGDLRVKNGDTQSTVVEQNPLSLKPHKHVTSITKQSTHRLLQRSREWSFCEWLEDTKVTKHFSTVQVWNACCRNNCVNLAQLHLFSRNRNEEVSVACARGRVTSASFRAER